MIKYKLISDMKPEGLEEKVNQFFDEIDKQGFIPISVKSYWDTANRRFFGDILYTKKNTSVLKEMMKDQMRTIMESK